MTRPRLLDLFCGAGGAAAGYARAGFEVVGVDINPQPRFPFAFILADALPYLEDHGREFDCIHASPPCQEYSVTRPLKNKTFPKLIEPVREALRKTGRAYVIENVPGAPLINPLMLCGTMFGLRVIRHRLFETNPQIWFPPFTCNHRGKASGCRSSNYRRKKPRVTLANYAYLTIAGQDYLAAEGRQAMGIDWMTKAELSQSIPPAYTEYIGKQLIEAIP